MAHSIVSSHEFRSTSVTVIDCLRAGGPLPALRFFVHPILTDSGVFALLISQHVALCCSTFYLITLTSRVFWVRLMLAIAWAVNPLFYAFAHSVGSEALSMILLLLKNSAFYSTARHWHFFIRYRRHC
jgi:hypothetical protein